MTDNNEISTITLYENTATNPAYVYLASLSPNSRRSMFNSIATAAAYLHGSNPAELWGMLDNKQARIAQEELINNTPWHALRNHHLQALRSVLAENYKFTSANKILIAVRQTITAAWRMNMMSTDDMTRAKDFKLITGANQDGEGRRLNLEEKLELLAAMPPGHKTPKTYSRDTAIIAIGLGCGLRRSEIASLQMSDIRDGKLHVIGKRNKERTVPMPQGTIAALNNWLAIRGKEPGPIFLRIRRGDNVINKGLTTQAIYLIINNRAAACGVEHFMPHDLRRSFATEMIALNVPLPTVKDLMGHDSVNTTALYDRGGIEAKEKAIRKLDVPYQRK